MLGIKDLSDQLGMSRSTTHRYAITLVELGYLEQGPSRKYRLALRGSDLGQAMLDTLPLRAQARSHLHKLRQQVSYTVSVAIMHDDTVRIVDRLHGFRGHARLGVTTGAGCRLPAYCTSLGKTLLANLPDAESRAIVRALTLTKHGPNTITQKHMLSRELLQVRDAGFAIDDQELAAGVLSIAMPVPLEGGGSRRGGRFSAHLANQPQRPGRAVRALPTGSHRANLDSAPVPSRHQPNPRGEVMATATLDPRGGGIIHARRGVYTKTEADVYSEIARAWCEMYPLREHPECPMRTHVVSPGFEREVWGRPEIDPQEVIAVCARVISVESWRLTEVQQTAVCSKLEEGLDPVTAWWHPLTSAPEVGLHFWRLAIGMIELRSVAPIDDSPMLESGRFAERNRRREEAALSRVRRLSA